MAVRDRVVLVTGSSRGIGRAIAERFAAAGARVILASRNQVELEAVAAALPGNGHRVVVMDQGEAASTADALAQMGHIDVLVANAGIAESQPYHRTDDAMWERTMQVNATGVARLCRAIIPRMVEAGWGRVIVVASNAALTGYAYSSAYCASKHAVLGYLRAVALEIARTPVTINAVCPGWVDTQMADVAVTRIAGKTGKSAAEARTALERMSPQSRMVEPAEVAALALFLCGEDARSIHGQAIPMDGGQVMK